ncbi:MAG TPA: M1 family metallopeptidase [Pyrinomonadaceae bacterium]|nr:M1 family metallopeptidase [Pyrinomonadaceae bacterium]
MNLPLCFPGKALVCLSFIFLLAGGAADVAVQAQNASFDVLAYEARIEPDIANKSVKGTVSVKFNSLENNLAEIQLNAGALEIDAVRERKTALKFEKRESLLIISLARRARMNEKREIEIEYHGTPRFGIRFFPEQQQRQVHTLFSTSQWMPCVDAPGDRAAFRLNLILPKDLKAVGNGRFVGESALPGDKISSVWEQKNPVPTYIFGFAAGNFREVVQNHRGVRLRYLASPQFSETEMRQIFRDTADMLDFFESKAGVRYADEVYTQVLAAGTVEQEMSGFTAMNEAYGREVLKNEKEIWLAAHEFAHQWWGNMVTNRDWTHFWLNEGVATFMTAAYKEHRFGRAEYLSEIEKSRTRYERVRDAGKDKSLVFPDWNKPTREDRTLVYQKGAYVTHLLREQMGDAAFWKGLKEYTQKYWGKSVTTADFQSTMEKSSGKDLSAFFNKWVYLAEN